LNRYFFHCTPIANTWLFSKITCSQTLKEIFEERMTDYEINVLNNVAAVRTKYQAKFSDPGEIMEWSGMVNFIRPVV
jgi:hypothetical protein